MSTTTEITLPPGTFDRAAIKQGALKQFYADNGYCIVRDGFTADEIDALRAETVAICRGERGEVRGAEVVDPAAATKMSDDELIAHFLCIHFPHKGSELMHKALAHPAIVDTLTEVIGPDVKAMQSMLFVKSAGKPGQAWHQDEDFIPTRDRSLCGAWIAMDDATVENGCLWILPGSHQPGILWPQYPHNDKRFDCTVESYDFPYTDEDAVAVEVPKGAVVFFNGYTLHRSLPNQRTTGFRRTLVNHYMSAASLLPWTYQEGMGIAKMDFRDIVMVAGKDPYAAWKPITDERSMHLRADGKGGCGDGRVDLETWKQSDNPKKGWK